MERLTQILNDELTYAEYAMRHIVKCNQKFNRRGLSGIKNAFPEHNVVYWNGAPFSIKFTDGSKIHWSLHYHEWMINLPCRKVE